MSSIYVILNESVVRGVGVPITEIVQPVHYTQQGALDALQIIAEEAGISLTDENSVYLPVKGTALESDEYYIEEVPCVD